MEKKPRDRLSIRIRPDLLRWLDDEAARCTRQEGQLVNKRYVLEKALAFRMLYLLSKNKQRKIVTNLGLNKKDSDHE